jgi:PHP family Zn ribbon phosphoesterase
LVYNKGVTTVYVQKIWKELVQKFGNEISVLIYTPLDELKNNYPELISVIEAFRNKTLQIQSGGGGRYGKILLVNDNDEDSKNDTTDNTLDNYFG